MCLGIHSSSETIVSTTVLSHSSLQLSALDAKHPLLRIRAALRANLTRLWPTRHKPLCPPAHGALVDAAALELSGLQPGPVLVLYLPKHFLPHLESLATMTPVVRTHPDVSLLRDVAYLSWSVPAAGGAHAPTVWVKLSELADVLMPAEPEPQRDFLQVLFVAEAQVQVGGFRVDAGLRARGSAALGRCEAPVTRHTPENLDRARRKADLYSERPWFLMPYELRNEYARLEVVLAPVCWMRQD